MKALLRPLWHAALRRRSASRWNVTTVPLSACVNYNSFGYGADDFHPLRSYLISLDAGETREARRKFIEFLQFYRPIDAAQALGIAPMNKSYPLFLAPWDSFGESEFRVQRTWRDDPRDCPDILTHFSERGLLSYRIEEEWLWSEGALGSLKTNGYKPREMSWIQGRALIEQDGQKRFLLTDGNHRAAAMAALRWEEVELQWDERHEVRASEAENWWGVRNGFFTREAALAIFHAYFVGNSNVRTTTQAAPILAPRGWKDLYF